MTAIEETVYGAILAVGATLAAVLAGQCDAQAQGPNIHAARERIGINAVHRSSRRELALDLARVCVNEAGWDSPADCALIWQVVEGHRAITDERRVWLTRHSARVLGGRDCAPGRNCRWTRNLAWSDAEPAEWPGSTPWDADRWARVRLVAWRLVTGADPTRPCEETPDTWDGRRWRERAAARGYRRVVCVDARNDGHVYRGRS